MSFSEHTFIEYWLKFDFVSQTERNIYLFTYFVWHKIHWIKCTLSSFINPVVIGPLWTCGPLESSQPFSPLITALKRGGRIYQNGHQWGGDREFFIKSLSSVSLMCSPLAWGQLHTASVWVHNKQTGPHSFPVHPLIQTQTKGTVGLFKENLNKLVCRHNFNHGEKKWNA